MDDAAPVEAGGSAREQKVVGSRAQRAWGSLILPVLITWGICSIRIGSSQMWQDEGATWWASQLAWDDFYRLLHRVDVVLAPYYVFMRGWTSVFGDSEAALRAPSTLAMGLTAGTISALGTRLVSPAIGLRAGLLFALIPLVSRYGQEARPYAFVALAASVCTLLFLRLRERPASKPRQVAYVASIVALGLVHLVALSLVVAHAMAFREHRDNKRVDWPSLRTFALCLSVAGTLLLPLIAIAVSQAAQINHGPLPDLDVKNLTRPLGSGHLWGQIAVALFLLYAWLHAGSSMFCSRADARASTIGSRADSSASTMLRTWALLPLVLLLATHSILHLFRMRYLVFTLPAWALLVALSLGTRALTTGLAVLLMGLLGGKTQLALREDHARVTSDYRSAAALIVAHARAGDGIAFGGAKGKLRHARLALSYELRHGPALKDAFADRSMSDEASFAAHECVDPRACLPADVQRIWLVTNVPRETLFVGMPAARAELLEREFTVSEFLPYWQGGVALLTRSQPVLERSSKEAPQASAR